MTIEVPRARTCACAICGSALTEAEAATSWDGCQRLLCAEHASDEIRRLRAEAVAAAIPVGYRSARVEDIEGEDEAVGACRAWAEAPRAQWLGLVGRSGNGKTTLAAATLREAALAHGGSVAWLSSARYAVRWADSAGSSGGGREWAVPYLTADLLVVDDLGADPWTASARDAAYYLVDAREQRGRGLLWTSNLDEGPARAARLGVPTADRLLRRGRVVVVRGQSWARRQGRG